MTNPPPVAPVVTDEMVQAAISAHTRNEIENWNVEGWKPSDAMRAAITAALRASGDLERLRAALKATQGRIMNVQFGLQTNTTKASAANDLSMIASKIATALQGDAP